MPAGFFQIPNIPYLFASFAHALGMAVWVGGIVALGAIAAPTLFRRLPRHEAGALFAPMLRVFEKVSLAAAVLAVAGAAAKAWIGGQHATLFVLIRFIALGGMCVLLFAGSTLVAPAMRRLHESRREADLAISQLPETDPVRVRFQALHRLSERLMTGQLLLGLVVLFLT